jgi:hypothetical protein
VRARASALFLLALVLGGCVVGNDEKQIDRGAVSTLVLASGVRDRSRPPVRS